MRGWDLSVTTPNQMAISKMYDLDGDGELDEAEQIMRDCDMAGRGHLSNDEIKLVEKHLSANKDVHLSIAFTVELDPLTDEEFEERRALVEGEMMEDVDHEDHLHQRLGRKEKDHCTCAKIAYDHGKI